VNIYRALGSIHANFLKNGDLHTTVMHNTYDKFAKNSSAEDVAFMNYGYHSLDVSEESPVLDPKDEIHRYPIQLYHKAVSGIDLEGKALLEVGSGRGGGANTIKKYLNVESIVGIDLSGEAVNLANRDFGGEGIQFEEGNAYSLPFDDNSFDVVLNVESSHCYTQFGNFLSEVQRVLRPGGHFMYTDFRITKDIMNVRNHLNATDLEIVLYEDISSNVVKALDLDTYRRLEMMERTNFSPMEKKKLYYMSGVKGTAMYRDFVLGVRTYYRYILKKTG